MQVPLVEAHVLVLLVPSWCWCWCWRYDLWDGMGWNGRWDGMLDRLPPVRSYLGRYYPPPDLRFGGHEAHVSQKPGLSGQWCGTS